MKETKEDTNKWKDCVHGLEDFILLKCSYWDFPGGTVVKNPPANAGGHGFEPWSRKIPHAVEQLSPSTTTTEPVYHNY